MAVVLVPCVEAPEHVRDGVASAAELTDGTCDCAAALPRIRNDSVPFRARACRDRIDPVLERASTACYRLVMKKSSTTASSVDRPARLHTRKLQPRRGRGGPAV